MEGQGEPDGGEEDEEEDLEEEMDAVLEGGKVTEATKKQEKEHERYAFPHSNPPYHILLHAEARAMLTCVYTASSWKPWIPTKPTATQPTAASASSAK